MNENKWNKMNRAHQKTTAPPGTSKYRQPEKQRGLLQRERRQQ